MSEIKDKIKDLLDQVNEDDVVLRRVQHLLEYALGRAGEYASDDEIVCYDIETGEGITMREHRELLRRSEEESDRDGTWLTVEELRRQSESW